MIRPLRPEDCDRCAAILSSLGQWFANPVSNAAYIDALNREPAFVATVDGDVRGFLVLRLHSTAAAEILVMAVAEDFHRQSLGRDLVEAAEDWSRARGVSWLHVKTRGPSTYDDAYERTRRFYRALGFEALYESMTEWGPQDSALILVKHLTDLEGEATDLVLPHGSDRSTRSQLHHDVGRDDVSPRLTGHHQRMLPREDPTE